MALVDSLLTAMVRANGDALVMHVGEKPIVVAGSRTIDLSGHGLPLGAMVGMLGQLLPAEARATLDEDGAVEHRLPDRGDDRFSVVAARGGDDIWIEIRRRRQTPVAVAEPVAAEEPPATVDASLNAAPAPDTSHEAPTEPVSTAAVPSEGEPVATEAVPTEPEPEPEPEPELAETVLAEAVQPETSAVPADIVALEPVLPEPETVAADPAREDTVALAAPLTDSSGGPGDAAVQDAAPTLPDDAAVAQEAVPPATGDVEVVVVETPESESASAEALTTELDEPASAVSEAAEAAAVEAPVGEAEVVDEAPIAAEVTAPEVAVAEVAVTDDAAAAVEPVVSEIAQPEPVAMLASAGAATAVAARPLPQVPMDISSTHGPSSGGGLPPIEPQTPLASPSSPADAPPTAGTSDEPPVLRTVRIEVPPRAGSPRAARVSRLLRTAADHGASELFLLSQARPTMRVDGSMRPIDTETSLTAADVESMLAEVTPEPWREAVGRGDPAEWLIELAEIGRVRCVAFRDHRGPGANFHVLSLRPVSLDELGLGGDARLLASEADGLVVLASPGADERARLVAAFVDGINRQRSDYVITIAPRVSVQHEPRQALLSQREVGSSAERALTAVRAALRESPDVLVVEDVGPGEVAGLLIEASAGGRLVIVSVPEASASAAVGWLLAQVPEGQRQAAAELASRCFRGALAQVPLRRTTGGRVAAREVLLGTAATARSLAAGAPLPAPDAGSLAEAVVGLVRAGVVDVREALRRVPDPMRLREALLAAGVDTTPIDRLA